MWVMLTRGSEIAKSILAHEDKNLSRSHKLWFCLFYFLLTTKQPQVGAISGVSLIVTDALQVTDCSECYRRVRWQSSDMMRVPLFLLFLLCLLVSWSPGLIWRSHVSRLAVLTSLPVSARDQGWVSTGCTSTGGPGRPRDGTQTQHNQHSSRDSAYSSAKFRK